MLLGNKKKQAEEQNWCVILSPVRNEIDKKKVARKVSEVFSLTLEEAIDLVSNTPIILLDNLTRDTAVKLKEFFRPSNAEILLTNDIFLKRKCYRTVWPEPPDLSFLKSSTETESESELSGSHPLDADEALQEIRAISEEPASLDARGDDKSRDSGLSRMEREQLLQEVNRWRNECISRREEIERLRESVNRIQKEKVSGVLSDPAYARQGLDKDKEIRELKAMLSASDEKYEALREEYQQARQVFEERYAQAVKHHQEQKGQTEGKNRILDDKMHALEKAGRELQQKLSEQKEQHERLQRDLAKESELNANRVRELTEDLSRERDQVCLVAAKMAELESQKRDLEQRLAEVRKEKDALNQSVQEIDEWKKNCLEYKDKCSRAEKEKHEIEQSVQYWIRVESEWREKYEAIEKDHDKLITQFNDEKFLRLKAEGSQASLEEEKNKLAEDKRIAEDLLRQQEEKITVLEHTIEQAQESGSSREAALQEKILLLEARDRELEAARRQLREMNLQIEQREAAQKRIQMNSQLSEKEAVLKRLVREQEQVETEIKQREDRMREILGLQENLEKEIVEIKQTQRHFLEQNKKERNGRVRYTINGDSYLDPSGDDVV